MNIRTHVKLEIDKANPWTDVHMRIAASATTGRKWNAFGSDDTAVAILARCTVVTSHVSVAATGCA